MQYKHAIIAYLYFAKRGENPDRKGIKNQGITPKTDNAVSVRDKMIDIDNLVEYRYNYYKYQ